MGGGGGGGHAQLPMYIRACSYMCDGPIYTLVKAHHT